MDWTVIKELRGGGQGTVARVARESDGQVGFLKRLREPDKLKARKRFYREVSSYRTLDHDRIPSLLDDNADSFRDRSIDLYL